MTLWVLDSTGMKGTPSPKGSCSRAPEQRMLKGNIRKGKIKCGEAQVYKRPGLNWQRLPTGHSLLLLNYTPSQAKAKT